jgi:hypothetical protein
MKLYQYGNYDEYVAAQKEGNQRKLHNIWVRPETVEKIAAHAPAKVSAVLCHGTRNGTEQKLFKKRYPAVFVIGTEIADTAMDYENTVQHDFHNERHGWLGKFDIVYSNSWDHAVHPAAALRTWCDQLAPGGRLFLEHGISAIVNRSTPTDPLEIEPYEVLEMLKEAGLRILHTFDAYGVKGAEDHRSVVYVTERA